MMDYKDIVKSSLHDDEKEMWGSVDRINGFLEHLKEHHRDKVVRFLKEEYEALNGRHLNETTARMLVDGMFHTERDREIVGEIVGEEESRMLLEGMDEETAERCRWDAYAGANGFMHDLAGAGLQKDAVLKSAKCFWFHDEDFSDSGKVYWYYSWMLF